MKTKFMVGLITLALCTTAVVTSNAQETKKKETAGEALEKTGNAIGKTASKVGNKTAEVAVKGSAKVADKVWKGKVAPDGSDVYINGKNKKYYVNKKGKKVYLKASQIKDKPVK